MVYAAFFRGLNVGGHGAVKMEELRAMLSGAGLLNVRTYIQSGNAVFSCHQPEPECAALIQGAFLARFGFESFVALRTVEDLDGVLRNMPFSANEIEAAENACPEVVHQYVYLADEPVQEDAVSALCAGYTGPDLLRAHGREIYLLCFESIRDSKLAAQLHKLGLPLTSRNFKTLRKVFDMAGMINS